MCECVFTSEAEVFLIDLDHEFPINISKHSAVHPVRHKPMCGTVQTFTFQAKVSTNIKLNQMTKYIDTVTFCNIFRLYRFAFKTKSRGSD